MILLFENFNNFIDNISNHSNTQKFLFIVKVIYVIIYTNIFLIILILKISHSYNK